MSILTDELLVSFESSIDTFENSDTIPAEIYTSEEFLDFERQIGRAHVRTPVKH